MLKKVLLPVFLIPVVLSVPGQTGTHWPQAIQMPTADSVLCTTDLKNIAVWSTSSTPKQQHTLFPEGKSCSDFSDRLNCAKITWYIIDGLFYDTCCMCPINIKNDPDSRSGFFVNQVREDELFPERVPINGIPGNLNTLNIAYYPDEKGLFNFDTGPGTFSAGMDSSGHLKNPQQRWGGIMRRLEGENINYKFIDFWLMDPFVESSLNEGGQLYIDMGDVSEDILNPGTTDIETGDHGYDNMDDQKERLAFQQYLDTIAGLFGTESQAYLNAVADPSCDKYHYFRGTDYDQQQLGILDRYRLYSGPDGNSTQNPDEQYPTIATTIPNSEDINRNGILDTTEAYYQYKIDLSPSHLVAGKNHIIEEKTVTTTFPNGKIASVRWFHFQVPVGEPDTITGDFSQVKSARFMRIFLKGFNAETHLRFAVLELSYLQERAYRNMITVYPNPTQGILTVDFDNRTPRAIMIYDQDGRLFSNQHLIPANGQVFTIDLTSFSYGIYFFRLVADQETIVKKVVVEK